MFFRKRGPKMITDEKRIDEILDRGVADILPSKVGLKKLLLSGKRITLYQGFDPTGADLHIGHVSGLRKLNQFQKLGHRVIFLIGDGTGQAGDPSGKTRSRETFFTKEELRKNAESYKDQVKNILNFSGENPVEILYNSKWLNKLRLIDVLDIANNFTLQQLSERDMFQERIKKGEPVNLREFLYPLLQGYDSVAMNVDLEIGGTDQLFNMLAGRTLVKKFLGKEKFVLTVPLLTDSEGKKIGKTEGNIISVKDDPKKMFSKIMPISDSAIVSGLRNTTSSTLGVIKKAEEAIEKGENPIEYKKLWAKEIVSQFHGKEKAKEAEEYWTQTFSEKRTPKDLKEIKTRGGEFLADILPREKIVESKNDFKRLIKEGAIKNLDTDETLDDPKIKVISSLTLKIGKHRFIKIFPEK